ncbi:MAG: response regulator transcription factor [Roseiflexaceae bacterium]
MTFKLLIADDARDIAEVVAFSAGITWPGCQITIATNGQEALRAFEIERPDLVILDVTMPPPNGLEVCKHIRGVSRVPILMLTVHDRTMDKVQALELGADDYLTKPFDHMELIARLRALIRRASGPLAPPDQSFVAGDFALDFATHQVRIKGISIPLTSTEYRLLAELVRHVGTTLPHHYLLEQVWGPEYVGDTHYLKVVVRRLRQKLGDPSDHPMYIQTEWGTGYRFIAPR